MSKAQFHWEDTSTPIYLHFGHKMFWEISLDENSKVAKVRYGKLGLGDVEQEIKEHNLEDISSANLDSQINSRLERGFQFSEKAPRYSITVTKASQPESLEDPLPKKLKDKSGSNSPRSQSGKEPGSLKRKIQDTLIHDDQKKVKTNDLAEAEKEQNQFILNKISPSHKQKKPENIMIEEEPEPEEAPASKSKQNSPKVNKENGKSKKFMIEPLPDLNDFKGEYLVNTIGSRVHFCKVQVLSRYMKVECGVVDNPRVTDVQVFTHKDPESAETHAKRFIFDKTMLGYKPIPDRFEYTITCTEFGFKEIPIVHIKVISDSKSPKTRSPRSKSPKGNAVKVVIEKMAEEAPEEKKEEEIDNSQGLKSKPTTRGSKKDKNQLSVHHKDFDAQSDSNLSPNFEFDDIEEVAQRREGKRSRSVAKSVSPERRPQSKTSSRGGLRKYALGDPVKGCYQALLDPYNYEDQDPKGWYMSENLDGVRCFWDGKEMWLRKGKKINTPEFFVKGFPASPLDGVLWAGRSQYQKCVTAVGRKKPDDHEWNTMNFKVFDVPEIAETFDKRLTRMEMAFTHLDSPYISLVKQYECKGKEHLKEELDKIAKEGGCGVMLRDPKSLYEKKRSKTLLEVKVEATEEATVLKHEASKSKSDSKIGGLRVKNEDGIEFSITIGVTEAVKKSPPKVGEKIMYKHRGKGENKVPKYPAFVRICSE